MKNLKHIILRQKLKENAILRMAEELMKAHHTSRKARTKPNSTRKEDVKLRRTTMTSFFYYITAIIIIRCKIKRMTTSFFFSSFIYFIIIIVIIIKKFIQI